MGLSIHSLTPDINNKITNHSIIPDWDRIIKKIKVSLRIAIVVTRYNKNEILSLIQFFQNIKILIIFNYVVLQQMKDMRN